MSDPCIICLAISGWHSGKARSPKGTPNICEIVESIHDAFEAGASVVHFDAYGVAEDSTVEVYESAQLKAELEKYCDGIIIHSSSKAQYLSERSNKLFLDGSAKSSTRSEMREGALSSFVEKSFDFKERLEEEMLAFDIAPTTEVFDLGDLFQIAKLTEAGRLAHRPFIQFFMGVENAVPIDGEVFDFYVYLIRRLFGVDVNWLGAGTGVDQLTLAEWSVAAGGHTRIGLGDVTFSEPQAPTHSYADLVRQVVEICEENERSVANWREARALLGLDNKPNLSADDSKVIQFNRFLRSVTLFGSKG